MKNLIAKVAAFFLLLFLLDPAGAQTPNPVTPGYQICNNSSGSTVCSWSPSAATGSAVTPVDCSGTITTGGSAQVLIAANVNVRGFQVMNIDTTEPMGIAFNGSAVIGNAGTYPIPAATASTYAGAGSYYSPIGFQSAAVSVVAATTGHKFSCTRW